jgi:hypothetical protein
MSDRRHGPDRFKKAEIAQSPRFHVVVLLCISSAHPHTLARELHISRETAKGPSLPEKVHAWNVQARNRSPEPARAMRGVSFAYSRIGRTGENVCPFELGSSGLDAVSASLSERIGFIAAR